MQRWNAEAAESMPQHAVSRDGTAPRGSTLRTYYPSHHHPDHAERGPRPSLDRVARRQLDNPYSTGPLLPNPRAGGFETVSLVRVLLPAILLGATGCVTLLPVRDPAQFIPTSHPQVVFVTYVNRTRMYVTQPRVSGDSLFGTMQGQSNTVAVPLSQVRLIEAVQHSRKRTIWMIAALAVATASGAWALMHSGVGEPCDYTLPEDTYSTGRPCE